MDKRRLEYLQRMGIDVWVPRGADSSAPGSTGTARQTVAPAPASEPETIEPSVETDQSAAVPRWDWPSLEQAIRGCTACRLHESRTQGVVGVGDRAARLLVIGEAPGAEEDRRGEPFVGRAGQLLDQMLRAIGLSRDEGGVYITNILKSRPPENRDPLADEVAACEPYLRRQLELISPQVILAVGRVAAQNLLKNEQPLGKLRGRWHFYGPRETPVWVTYHPAYLLRSPAEKGKAWQDLKQVRDRLASVS